MISSFICRQNNNGPAAPAGCGIYGDPICAAVNQADAFLKILQRDMVGMARRGGAVRCFGRIEAHAVIGDGDPQSVLFELHRDINMAGSG